MIAHHTVRKRMAAGNEVTKDKPAPPEALPVITFDDEMTLYLNGEEIRLLHLPPGHTDGDVVVFFKKANVVCMGDVFIAPAASFGDRWYGGGYLALIGSLEFVLPQIPEDATIVPGHGKISTRADVVRGLEALEGNESRGRSRDPRWQDVAAAPGGAAIRPVARLGAGVELVGQVTGRVGQELLSRDRADSRQ